MTALRRHLASMGLAVVLCHLMMQVLVPAALCCERMQMQPKAAFKECCPAGSHPGQVCPMHGKSRAASSNDRDCTARSQVNLEKLFVVLTTGGVVPPVTSFNVPTDSEATPDGLVPPVSIVTLVPPGPPPRA